MLSGGDARGQTCAEGRSRRRNPAAVVRAAKPDRGEESGAVRPATRRKRMRKITMVAVMVAALLVMTAGIALADSFRGTDGPNTIVGTNDRDTIDGLAGDDNLFGRGGNDRIFGNRGDDDIGGGGGRDRIDAGRGDDFINVQGDDRRDVVRCGSGRDVVRANPQDAIAGDCEVTKAAPLK